MVRPSAIDRGAADLERRFGGVARAYGRRALTRFRAARVAVIGLGGVGSWAVEALARSGIGGMTLIDLDNIAESNVNRQIHALDGAFGQAKVDAMARRVAAINPSCALDRVEDFVTQDNLHALLSTGFDYVVDCIDDSRVKAALIAHCRGAGIDAITLGGAGGRIDPLQIRADDLALSRQDALLARVRSLLRREYGFPRAASGRFGITCVFSGEPLRYPTADGGIGLDKPGDGRVAGLSCAGGLGSVMHVTAAFALVATAHVLTTLAAEIGVNRA